MQDTAGQTIQSLIAAGSLPEAERQLAKLLARNPNRGDLQNLMGIVHLLAGGHDLAIHHFGLALRADPLCGECLANLGNALRQRGRLAEAETALRRALSLAPERKEKVLFDLGSLRHERGDLEEAAALFREALALAPDYAKALNDLALVARKLGAVHGDPARLDEAGDCLDRLRGIDPGFPGLDAARAALFRERARLHAAAGDLDAASRWCAERGRLVSGTASFSPVLNEPPGEATLRSFRDCRVFPGAKDWFLVDAEGRLRVRGLCNSNLETSPWCCVFNAGGRTLLREAEALPLPVERAVLLGGGDNYWHWMIDFLPRLHHLAGDPDLEALPLLLNRDLAAFQKETLAMLGIPSGRLVGVPSDRPVACRELIAPPISGDGTTFDTKPLAWLRDALSAKVRKGGKRPRRVYVSRRDARKRRVLNEKALIARLRRLGFEILEFGRLRVADQIHALQEAEVIVGLHGAAFANLLFMRPGAKVLELVPAGEDYPHYVETLAQALNLRHHAIPCPSRAGDPDGKEFSHDVDIIADIDGLEAALERLGGP